MAEWLDLPYATRSYCSANLVRSYCSASAKDSRSSVNYIRTHLFTISPRCGIEQR